ncbi:N-acetylglucosamine-6-phosphate deacetylase, partial [Caulobacter sp. 602-2]|nr:N-acetylglucosamine-6-phosphate deacetylase [Caulobacter sp. 602-2]
MPVTALTNAAVMTPAGVVDGQALLIDGATIVGLVDRARIPAGAVVEDLVGGLLVPGFIDTQVNGGGGVLFNDAPTVETIAAIGAAHRPFGTTGFLPTLISDDLDVVDAAMRA